MANIDFNERIESLEAEIIVKETLLGKINGQRSVLMSEIKVLTNMLQQARTSSKWASYARPSTASSSSLGPCTAMPRKVTSASTSKQTQQSSNSDDVPSAVESTDLEDLMCSDRTTEPVHR